MNNYPQLRNWIILITVVLLVIAIGVTVNGRDRISAVENALGNVVRPLQHGLMSANNYIAEKTYPIRNVFKLADENEALKKELIKTQQALISQTMLQEEYNELKTLRKSLNYAYRNDLNNFITTDVIARDQGNWYGMFIVNAGLEQGVTENAMVFNGSGLIGQVFEVGKDWSKILTITDIKGTVSFQIVDDERSFDGIVSGVSEEELEGYLFDPKGVIYPGDQIITSGLGIYPKGIIIGTVSEVVEDKDTLLKEIKVKPNVDFKNIDRVFIIPETHTFTE